MRVSTAELTLRSSTTSKNRHRDRPYVIVSSTKDGASLIVSVSDGLKGRLPAPAIMKRLGLRGGGRPDFAQGGGVDPVTIEPS